MGPASKVASTDATTGFTEATTSSASHCSGERDFAAMPAVPVVSWEISPVYGTEAARAFVRSLDPAQITGDFDSVTDRFGPLEEGLLDAVIDVGVAKQPILTFLCPCVLAPVISNVQDFTSYSTVAVALFPTTLLLLRCCCCCHGVISLVWQRGA